MSDYQPPAATVLDWLHSNLGGRVLAALTGTDTRMLRAAVQIIEAYSYNRTPSVLVAFAAVVEQMQSGTRELAYHAIAHPMDWSDRSRVWLMAGLGAFKPRMVCSFEPGGLGIDHAEEEEKEAARRGV